MYMYEHFQPYISFIVTGLKTKNSFNFFIYMHNYVFLTGNFGHTPKYLNQFLTPDNDIPLRLILVHVTIVA